MGQADLKMIFYNCL